LIKLSLIELESCLKPFDIIQTHLPSRAPPITLSPFFSLSAAGPNPLGLAHSSAPPLSLPSLSSNAYPAHDPTSPSPGYHRPTACHSCPGPPTQACSMSRPPSSSTWPRTDRTPPIPLFPRVPPATKGALSDPTPLFSPCRKPSSLCVHATLPPLPHRAPPCCPPVTRGTSSAEIRVAAAAMAAPR
jgi:hypothetical protein